MQFSTTLLGAAMLLSPTLHNLVSCSPVLAPYQHLQIRQYPNGTNPYPGNQTYPHCNYDNPFKGRKMYVNSGYPKKLEETIASFLAQGDELNAARTRTVQKVSTFAWVSSVDGIAGLKTNLEEAAAELKKKPREKLIFPFVIYNLPERDCSAKASDGEFHLDDDGLNKYRKFIDDIVAIIESREFRRLDYAIILEPDSLGNLVTNLQVEKCQKAEKAYLEGLGYAVSKLQQKNIALYIDAAHSNWLGWPDNLEPSAKLYKKVLDLAGKSAKIRGFATNVSNYNGYNSTTPDIIYGPGPDNANWSEQKYVNALTPFLEAEGLPAHFIIDQGRSGQQNIRTQGGHWCNIADAGFGIRPTTDTSDCTVDALVWVKPGGESDGTSDLNATRYDTNCRSEDAKFPAPEAGQWFDAYVQDLVKNANPQLEPTYLPGMGPGGM